MNTFAKLRFYLRTLFAKRKLDEQLSEEVRTHVEMATDANLAKGMSADEARYAALREFGNVAGIQEQARDERGWVWLEQLGQDLRYAVRQILRNPGYASAVVIVMALGIGANTAIFGLVDGLLFRPLPVRDPARLLAVSYVGPEGRQTRINISAPFFQFFRQHSQSFTAFIGYAPVVVTVRTGAGDPETTTGQVVSGDYFSALGIKPVLGRLFGPEEDRVPGRDAVAVISHECWQKLFAGDAGVIGRTFVANKQSFAVIGVAPRGFHGLNSFRRAQFWVPSAMERELGAHTTYDMAAKLAPAVNSDQATAELESLTRQLAANLGRRAPVGYERYGGMPEGYRPTLVPAARGSFGPQGGGRENIAKLALLFGGAVALVLLAAGANAANLLLLRALARRREIAVRLTLGATRWRLLRQFGVESLLLSLLAAGFGLILAHWGMVGLLALRAGYLARVVMEAAIDGRMVAFTVGLAVLTGLVFGLVPAWQALKPDLHTPLKQDALIAPPRQRLFAPHNLLVLGQVTAGLVLLLGAGLCLRSFVKLITVDPGFETQNTLTATISLEREKYPNAAASSLVTRLLDNLKTAPGVRGVTLTNHMVPLSGNIMRRGVDAVEGYAPKPGEKLQFGVAAAGSGYFRLLGIPLVMGREFDAGDVRGRPEVALVNESFVRRYWPGQNPLGRHIDRAEVVGVVADSRSEQLWLAPEPQMFPAIMQGDVGAFTLLVKTEGDPAAFAPMLRRELEKLDKTLKPARIETLEGIWSDSLAGQRMMLVLLGVFAGLALALASVGLYGLVACSVAQRTREIGIRMAIGAQRRDVMRLVLGRVLALVWTGLALGVVLALVATRALEKLLYGITPADLPTYLGVTLLMAAIAFLACWLPARRAARVDPVVALRAE